MPKFCDLSGAKECKSCRSRRELSNEYLIAKIGFDTAENEPLKVWGLIQFNIQSSPWSSAAAQAASSCESQSAGGDVFAGGDESAKAAVITARNSPSLEDKERTPGQSLDSSFFGCIDTSDCEVGRAIGRVDEA